MTDRDSIETQQKNLDEYVFPSLKLHLHGEARL